MKKFAIASILAIAAMSASAVEVGVTGSRDYSGVDRNGYGVTIGQTYGAFNVTAGIAQFTQGTNDQTRTTLVGSREIVKLGPVSVAGRLGGAYLANQTGSDGFAATVGVGASVPLAKKVSLGVSVDRQYGQDRVSSFDGNIATVAVKYSF